uniref:Uncharacterized protein n=1 Tax=Streptomyces rochei TaxID=1928 RepID=A0A1B1WA80_STRRO|nr:hypothetical protein [Streptomyces rochei]
MRPPPRRPLPWAAPSATAADARAGRRPRPSVDARAAATHPVTAVRTRHRRGGTAMSTVLDLQGLEAPAEEAAALGSTISNNCG